MGEQKPADPGKGALDEVGMSQALLSSLISVSARGRGADGGEGGGGFISSLILGPC